MTANHDTPEAVEAMALDVERTFYSDAAGMLRRLHQRAVDAERERDEAARLRDAYRSNEATVITENDGLRWTLNNTRASLVTARADVLREFQQGCPFDRENCSITPETPCPACGDLGTWDYENLAKPSRCISRNKEPRA